MFSAFRLFPERARASAGSSAARVGARAETGTTSIDSGWKEIPRHISLGALTEVSSRVTNADFFQVAFSTDIQVSSHMLPALDCPQTKPPNSPLHCPTHCACLGRNLLKNGFGGFFHPAVFLLHNALDWMEVKKNTYTHADFSRFFFFFYRRKEKLCI